MQAARERVAFELEDMDMKLDPEPILTELIHLVIMTYLLCQLFCC